MKKLGVRSKWIMVRGLMVSLMTMLVLGGLGSGYFPWRRPRRKRRPNRRLRRENPQRVKNHPKRKKKPRPPPPAAS